MAKKKNYLQSVPQKQRKDMLTVRELMDNTPGDVRSRSNDVYFAVNRVSRKPLKSNRDAIIFEAQANAATEKFRYDQTIILYPYSYEVEEDDGSVSYQMELPSVDHLVWLHCSCPFFQFRNEWVLDLHGNSSLTNAIDSPPRITNPDYVPYVCKHLYRGLPHVIEMMRDIAKNKRKK